MSLVTTDEFSLITLTSIIKVRLTYSGGTDRPGNFSISNDLTQILNFPTRIPDCDSYSPALSDLLSSNGSTCSTMAFPPLGNSDHVVVSVSIDFSINSKQDAPFHRVVYDLIGMVFVIIWEMFHGKISLNSVLPLLLVKFVNGFRLELMDISLIESIRSNLTHLHGFRVFVLLP